MANGDAFSFDDFSKPCNTLEIKMLEMRTSKGTRFIMFQELVIRSLGEMKDWIQNEISSINYALVIDIHYLIEHINSSGTLLKKH